MIRFCLHRWARWSAPYLDHFAGEGRLLQATQCERCGKVWIAHVRQPLFSRSPLQDLLSRLGIGGGS